MTVVYVLFLNFVLKKVLIYRDRSGHSEDAMLEDEAVFAAIKAGVDLMPPGVKMFLNSGEFYLPSLRGLVRPYPDPPLSRVLRS